MNLDGLKLEAVPGERPPVSRFIITLTFMHGDADLDTTERLVAHSREELDDFFVVVDRYFGMGWNERIEVAEKRVLNEMPEYWIFTSADNREDYETDEHPDWFEEYWPCDKTNDCWGRTMLTKYVVRYFDEQGAEFVVTREEKEDENA